MSEYPPAQPLRLLAVNIHKGYNASNRRHVLHELREAVRAVRSRNHDVSLRGAEPRGLKEVFRHTNGRHARLAAGIERPEQP